MWAYLFRRLAYNMPVYLGVILLVMAALRVNDPVYAYLGKNVTEEQIEARRESMGLKEPFLAQYAVMVKQIATLDFDTMSWRQQGTTVGELMSKAIWPSLALTVPALILTSVISICVSIIAAFFRGRTIDRSLVVIAVLGMSISFLVYIIVGQYFGAYLLNEKLNTEIFAIHGYKSGILNWPRYCLLPVLISVIVAMGYDTRFYRAVMVEESNRDYITTAKAKGASRQKIMFVHMLKNAMIPIVTRISITLPFLIVGSILLEVYFGIPGMGQALISAVTNQDFPVVQAFTAVFAGLYILTNLMTDVMYALLDPRVRLS
ncbi:MAG: peptide ABC transporter permease [Planctomycetaceae bacterium]|nr:peptide ABC transporter permease [Planctomycetaceae bacterium]